MRTSTISALTAAPLLALLSTASPAAEPERGRLLYENHCLVCHESAVHVRENRRVTTRIDIMEMITRWSAYLDLDWTGEEMFDVLEYLDQRYYHTSPNTM